MGLFSRFRKSRTNDDVDDAAADDVVLARLSADSELQRQRAQSDLQREIARATALKIDAIEAAMAADIFNEPEPAFRRPPRPVHPPLPVGDGMTLPLLDEAVTEMLGEDAAPAQATAAETAPLIEEVAILYANGDHEAARLLLQGAIAEDTGPPGTRDRTAWWMLFDLHQVRGDEDAFDSLSIDYASTFETSPPPWNPALAARADAYSGVTPTVTFAGALDATAAAQIAQMTQPGAGAALRLDFSRIVRVEPEGCALLLDTLIGVAPGRELILVGAEELTQQLRAIIDVGRRAEGEAPWLLLLELLRLLNHEKAFEEASMDYCVTFEVSPPPFVGPGKVLNAPRQNAPAADRYLLPQIVEMPVDTLLTAIDDYADRSPALIFDCTRLQRIESGAAGQLLAPLQTLAAAGRHIEFRELNHLVAALLRMLGYGGIARLVPHRY